jgi:heat shock protein HslJ
MTASRLLAFTAVLMLAAAACGEDTVGPTTGPVLTSPVSTSPVTMSPVGSDADALARTSWVARSISSGAATSGVVPGSEPTLEFGDIGATVSGSTGCNLYSAAVTIGGGTISFSDLTVTERGCTEEAIMEQEAAFLAILIGADVFRLADDILEITGPAGAVSLVEPAVVVDVPLSGTPWELETLIEGDTASSVLFTTFPTLTVDVEQGSMRGTTGCNDYGGMVAVQGNELVVSDLAWTEIGCDRDVMRQEGFMLEVLQGARLFEIQGDRLTILGPAGTALVYRAR